MSSEDFKNEFSWSKSRDDVFNECRRQYYFQYYGSWGGWEENAPEKTRQIYVLKLLVSRHMWAGDLVHRAIERSLKNIQSRVEPLTCDKIVGITKNLMRTEWKSSRDKNYWTRPKSIALYEHEYEIAVSDEEWKTLADKLEACLQNFYQSELFGKIQKLPLNSWLEVENLSSFDFEGTKIWVKTDFSYRTGKRITIVDWKTGYSSGDNTLQLACYALYGTYRWQVAPGQIDTVIFNVSNNVIEECALSSKDIERTKDYIKGSIRDMRALLRNPDNNEVDENDFSKADDKRRCNRCNFKKIC
jgi:CRISPR/Cas system-associated exonuclease Cas4 (RecB family)